MSLERAIIVDLDGTLCLHNGRGPFEFDKCDSDLINKPVKLIIELYGCETGDILFVSGREASCRIKTLRWIADNIGVKQASLFMRPEGDYRKDSIIKEEIYNEQIKPYYAIDFVLDDRNQVVEMWRKLGLTCLQVAEGNF